MTVLDAILGEIRAQERLFGRVCDATNLIAVSKQQPNDRVAEVLIQGHRLFGENRVQEAAGKWPDWQQQYPDVQLHLIGPLQTNKTRQAIELFDAIHTLDRPKLANSIARLAQELGHCPTLFIQVNTGAEPQKAGVLPQELDAFVSHCGSLDLPVVGLMCIPPAAQDPTEHFAMLAEMAKRNGLPDLSMGMSGDYKQAIAMGATYVRIGSAIFGDRD